MLKKDDVARYELVLGDDHEVSRMSENRDGDYVDYYDYLRLLNRFESLYESMYEALEEAE